MTTEKKTEKKPKNAKFLKTLFLIIGLLGVISGTFLAASGDTDDMVIGFIGLAFGALFIIWALKADKGKRASNPKNQWELKPEDLAKLSDQELLQQQKQNKIGVGLMVVLWGVFVGIAIYNATTDKEFLIGVLLPVLFVLIAIWGVINSSKISKAIKAELKSRGLD